jgi:hypothetical protein
VFPDRPVHYPLKRALLHDPALENLQYIRETMERSTSFTAVPGWGGAAMGTTALVAAAVAARQTTAGAWLATWLVEAALAVALGGWTLVRKARTANVPVLSGAGRRFALSLCPPLMAGAVLTAVLYRAGMVTVLPGLWLMLYGAGVATGGAFSVRVVPLMGLSLMILGAASLFCPPAWGAWFMGLGFGIVQIVCGIIIARRYGG